MKVIKQLVKYLVTGIEYIVYGIWIVCSFSFSLLKSFVSASKFTTRNSSVLRLSKAHKMTSRIGKVVSFALSVGMYKRGALLKGLSLAPGLGLVALGVIGLIAPQLVKPAFFIMLVLLGVWLAYLGIIVGALIVKCLRFASTLPNKIIVQGSVLGSSRETADVAESKVSSTPGDKKEYFH